MGVVPPPFLMLSRDDDIGVGDDDNASLAACFMVSSSSVSIYQLILRSTVLSSYGGVTYLVVTLDSKAPHRPSNESARVDKLS